MKNLYYSFEKSIKENDLIQGIISKVNSEEECRLTARDNSALATIIYMFDKKSRIKLQQPSWETRWIASAKLAGYKGDVMHLASFENPSYLKFMQLLLQYQNSKVFSILTTYEHLFNEFTYNLLKPLAAQGKDLLQAAQMKSKLREELRILVSEIRSLENEYYGDETNTQGIEDTFTNYSSPEALMKSIN